MCLQPPEGLQARVRIGPQEAQPEMDTLTPGPAPIGGSGELALSPFSHTGSRGLGGCGLEQGEPQGIVGQPQCAASGVHLEAGAGVKLAHVLDEHQGSGV